MPQVPDDFRFPTLPHDDAQKLLAQTGSFWTRTYDGRAFVQALLFAHGQAERQNVQDLTELQQALSRFTVPILHRRFLSPLRLLESEVTRQPLRIGDGHVIGPNPPDDAVPVLGGTDGRHPYGAVVPESTKYVPLITNRITEPSWVMVAGVDFELVPGRIHFRTNPFENPFAAIEPVYEGTEVVDRAMMLWLWEVGSDVGYIEQHYGYTIGVSQPSSPNYRDIVNSVWDAWVEGTSQRTLQELVAAVVGNPLCRGTEVVEYAGDDAVGKVVVTDQNVYRLPSTANITVSAGQTLNSLDPLTDTVTFYELTAGELASAIESLQITKEMLAEGYVGGLVFRNEEVPLVVETVAGKTKVSFAIEGFPSDVTAFWDEVHARGTAVGAVSLARLLDQRGPAAATEPIAAVLPATVNPAEFLVANILRFNAGLVRIKTAGTLNGAASLEVLRLLRKLVPPWQMLLVLVELTAPEDELNVPDIGEEAMAGLNVQSMSESLSVPSIGSENMVLYYVNCSCV